MPTRKHQPHWKDSTRTARSQKRTKQDDEWANTISGGRYPTLRKLMTAIHNGEFALSVDVAPKDLAKLIDAAVNDPLSVFTKKAKK